MSVQVKRRREAAAFLAGFTGAQGELIVDTTNNRVQVHDGATPGGFPAAKLNEVLQSANNLSDLANKPAALTNLGAVALAQIGAASGVAALDSTGHIPASQLPASVGGGLQYQGTWNAATNSPALVSGTGTKGYFYKVSVAGPTSVDSNSQWNAGDMIVFDGTVWDKIDGPSSGVISVAGQAGNVTAAQILAAIEAAAGSSGTGGLVFSNAPSLVTPNLGTPSSLNLANASGLPASALPAFTGDVTSPAGSSVNSLATVNPAPGSIGSSTAIPVLTTNAKGLVTAQTAAPVVAPAATLTGNTLASNVTASSLTSVGSLTAGNVPASLLSGTLLAAQEPARTGDMTNNAGSLVTAVSSIGGKPVSLGGAFSMSGAYSFSGILTANTSLTFPSSGTVTALGNASTGSGAFVLSTSPTLISPNLGTPAAVNLSNATSLPAAALPALSGDITTVAGSTVTSVTKIGGIVPGPAATALAGQIPGTATGDNASSGNIGEYLSAIVSPVSPMSLTSGTPTTLASITLTPGDWDVWTQTYFIAATGTSVTYSAAGYSGSTGLIPAAPTNGTTFIPVAYVGNGTALMAFATPARRTSISTASPVYNVVQCNFSGGTCTAYGSVQARRVR